MARSRPRLLVQALVFCAALSIAPAALAQAAPALELASELGPPDTVITQPELASYGNAFYELEEALAAREGITFNSSGDVGSEDWILIRGLPRDSSRNVLVLLDGAPINNAAYEGVEAHDLPAAHIARVEIFRPPLPARFGGYHAVIAFYTAPRRDQAGTSISASGAVGSLATQRASAELSTRDAEHSIDASFSVLSTDALSGRFRTPPFENLRYEDRSYWDWVPTVRAEWQPNRDTRVSSFATFSKSDKRFSDDEYRTRWFALSGVLASHRASREVTLRTALHAGYERYFLRLRMHPDVGLQYRRRLGGRAEVAIEPDRTATTLIGVEGDQRQLDTNGALAGLTTLGGFAEQRLRPLSELELGGGARLDLFKPDHDDFGHAHAGQLGLSWSASATAFPWRAGSLGVRFGRTLRAPALGELSAHRELEPEVLTGGEIRAKQRLLSDRFSASVAAFALRLEREIGIGADGVDENSSGSLRTRGIESRLEVRWTSLARSYATYTLTHAEHEEGTPVAFGAPKHMASAGLLLSSERTLGRLSLRYLGKKEGILRHMGEDGRIRDALIVDLYAERRLSEGLAAFVQGGNLTNLSYETFQGRPMLPRTVLVGITIEQELSRPRLEKESGP